MSYVNDLIREVRESRHKALKEVALVSGYAIQTIHDYETGRYPVPAEYLAGLFRATRDARLVQFIWPDVAFYKEQPRPADPPPGDPRDSVITMLNVIQVLAKATEYNAKVVRDNKIDAEDDQSILAILGLMNTAVKAITDHAANLAYWRNQTAKGNKR